MTDEEYGEYFRPNTKWIAAGLDAISGLTSSVAALTVGSALASI